MAPCGDADAAVIDDQSVGTGISGSRTTLLRDRTQGGGHLDVLADRGRADGAVIGVQPSAT
jgi:hypothetical protein